MNLGRGEWIFPVIDLLETRGAPYVLATSYGDIWAVEGKDAKPVAVLRKPYDPALLAEALARAVQTV